MATQAPTQLGSIKATWEQACVTYGLNDKVKEAILDQWADVELRTWRHMFPDLNMLQTWVKAVPGIEAKHTLAQGAKIGRMLHEYKEAMDSVEKKGGPFPWPPLMTSLRMSSWLSFTTTTGSAIMRPSLQAACPVTR